MLKISIILSLYFVSNSRFLCPPLADIRVYYNLRKCDQNINDKEICHALHYYHICLNWQTIILLWILNNGRILTDFSFYGFFANNLTLQNPKFNKVIVKSNPNISTSVLSETYDIVI